VVRVPYGGRIGYAPAKSAAQVAAERMREALQSSNEHHEILQRFITTLSPDEEDALRAALDGDRRS
jgi:predicted transcriptional regulator